MFICPKEVYFGALENITISPKIGVVVVMVIGDGGGGGARGGDETILSTKPY